MPTKIIMPQLGESVVDGTVVEWLKQIGDPVEEYEPVVRVSTDKVDTEIPAPIAGILLEIHVPPDSTVDAGVVLGLIGNADDQPSAPSPSDTTPAQTQPAPIPQASPTPQTPTPSDVSAMPHITPVVARMAQVHQLDLTRIKGTGRNGRITKKDVEAHLEAHKDATDEELAPWEQPGSGDLFKPTVEYADDAPPPSPAPSKPRTAPQHQPSPSDDSADGTTLPISAMRRTIAHHMVESKRTAPHVTTVFEADLSAIVAHRSDHKDEFARQGVRLTFTPYFVSACVQALQEHPMLNARWLGDDEGILQHHVAHIGIAVALEEGLIVPVLKNAQDYNLMGLARQVNDLAERARQRKLNPDEVRGGTFSITNHGVSGSLFATPIINQPQSAILGVGAIDKRVKVINDAIAIRPCAYLSLTFDHRLIDGATADNFVASVVQALQNWR